MLGTIERSGAVIDLFTLDTPEWGVREISRELGEPKTNVHAVLSSLAEIGLLERTASARYRLGWRILEMGRVLVTGSGFRRSAQVAMRRVADRVPGAVSLAVLDRGDALCIAMVQSPGLPWLPPVVVGARTPAHETPAGRMLLRGGNGTADWHSVEAISDFTQIAVPVLDPAGATIASMAMTAPSTELPRARDRCLVHLHEASALVHRAIRDEGARRTATDSKVSL